jgi:hypothetical protein
VTRIVTKFLVSTACHAQLRRVIHRETARCAGQRALVHRRSTENRGLCTTPVHDGLGFQPAFTKGSYNQSISTERRTGMARIRSVKPELRTDLTVGAWPIPVRYAWVLLWGYLDDSGRGRDDLRLLVSDLFPLDRDVTERKLDGWLQIMATTSGDGDEPPLCRYEVEGRRFLHSVKWGRHQRISHATDSRMPPCPVHDKPGSDS